MEPSDLTILFLTANKVPKEWAEFQKEKLIEAAGDSTIITLSMEPLDWGVNVLQGKEYGISNIYLQLLRGAKMATTEYVAVAEDDILYPSEHFAYRPPLDAFGYNLNRLNVFTWGKPTYFWKNRVGNSVLIASRDLTVEALEERFAKHPDGTPPGFTGELGRANVEKRLGVTPRRSVSFETEISVVKIDHEFGIDRLARTHRKGMGPLRSYDIPYWGRAEDVVRRFR